MKRLPEHDPAVLERVAREHSIDLLVAFGSTVKGTARPESDFDVAVWRFRTCKRDLTDPDRSAEEELRLFENLNRVFDTPEGVDMVIVNYADSTLLMEVATHGVAIYERGPGDFLRFKVWAAARYNDDEKYRRGNRRFLLRGAAKWKAAQ